MKLEKLGFNNELQEFIDGNNLSDFIIGRVLIVHKERYLVLGENGEYDAEILGNLRFTAQSRSDFPVVGDWVAMQEFEKGKGLIHSILPRKTIMERQAVGKLAQKQIIAANVDAAFIIQAVDRDFSLNRIERYLTICYNSKVTPFIILNKIDLIEKDKRNSLLESIKNRVINVDVYAISNISHDGYDKLERLIEKGKTYCLLGSSGVGKSTLVNNLSEKEVMKTGEISEQIQRGKHVTSHRELVLLKNGGILIDNPGMRELGIADSREGLAQTYEIIEEVAVLCKYTNCSHVNEDGCKVLQMIAEGEIDEALYENFLKMKLEKQHFEQDAAEKRQKDKDFGKMIKNVKKDLNKLSSKHKGY